MRIKKIEPRVIYDSKGEETVEVVLRTKKGKFRASCPSGVSTGKYEAKTAPAYEAVQNIRREIAPIVEGMRPTKQKRIDKRLMNLKELGANALLPVSIAVARAGAASKGLFLWDHISSVYDKSVSIPRPLVLMIEGGLHGGGSLDVQEFMVAGEFEEMVEFYHDLQDVVRERFGAQYTNVGLEGGLAGLEMETEEVLDLLVSIDSEIEIVLDVAASHLRKGERYELEGQVYDSKGLALFYSGLAEDYPILGIEDPFDQDDEEGWKELKEMIVIGDDLTVTNKKRIKRAKSLCNGLVVKPNQIGTVTESVEAVELAQKFGWTIFAKHRSGETNDSFLADLAVGAGADYLMAGAPVRGERLAKYNRLLEIKEEI